MSAAERLDDYLERVDGLDERPEHYRIGDRGHELNEAEWAMTKLADLKAKVLAIQTEGNIRIETIKAWMAHEVGTFTRDIEFFEHLLVEWHQRRLTGAWHEAGEDWAKVKGKTCRLPSGVVSARMTAERVEVEDEGKFLLWAREMGAVDLYRAKYEPEKAAIKEHIKETGEVVPGVTLVPGDVTFKVTVGNDARKEADD